MGRNIPKLITAACLGLGVLAQADPPALTVYNQQFAVVREAIDLDLDAGVTAVAFDEITAHVEPDSVILRDPEEERAFRILEQNYRADPLSEGLLLQHFEGQEIQFRVVRGDNVYVLPGRIVRSGYVPHQQGLSLFGQQYWQRQMMWAGPQAQGQPIIEIEGSLQFGLPGTPLFPTLGEDTLLKPTLHWRIEALEAGPLDAELSYVTGGMTWEADYNAIAPETGDEVTLTGWITLENQSGRDFREANVRVMAGDVSKLRDEAFGVKYSAGGFGGGGAGGFEPIVTEQAFDEYHLYTLEQPVSLLDRETKQVEFLRAEHVEAKRLYVYDGVLIPEHQRHFNWHDLINDPSFATDFTTKVRVEREIENIQDNGLGIPLPKGRVRVYRQGDDGRPEFIGEDDIDHTPRNETFRLFTGNAFDLVGERLQTNYRFEIGAWAEESFRITLRNRKEEPASIVIVEYLHRYHNWRITQHSDTFEKVDSTTIEFTVDVPADGEKVVEYTVFYPVRPDMAAPPPDTQ